MSDIEDGEAAEGVGESNIRRNKTSKKSTPKEDSIFEILQTYFERNENSKIKCKVIDCKSSISRWRKYYMERHFLKVHPTLYGELFPSMLCEEKQGLLDLFELSISAIELVTVNGYPFSLLDSTGFRSMRKKQVKELEKLGFKFTINRHNVADRIEPISLYIQDQIKKEMNGKLISIMFDICKKKTFAVLGVSAATMRDGIAIARSLGMVQLTERHRGPYLANEIEDLLAEYSVSLKQICTATTDKASNMNNTVRHLALYANAETEIGDQEHNQNEENELDSEGVIDDVSDDDVNDDMELADENFIELAHELNNGDRFVELVKDLTDELHRRNNYLSLIHQVDCCAHKVQLSVNAAVQNSNAIGIIEEVREMTRLLRTTVVNIEFKKHAPKCVLPPQHVDTRWNADYLMLFGFSRIKYAIIELSKNKEFGDKFTTTDIFWQKVDEIITTLKPLYIATQNMQKVGYGLSDFFISWMRIEKNLGRFNSDQAELNLSAELLRELNVRRSDLFDTPCMVAAIYLDPRVKFKLNNTQKECAILHLKNLFIRLQQLEMNESGTEKDHHHDTLDELNEEYAMAHSTEDTVDTSYLMESMGKYDAVKHVDFKCGVMDFWQKHKEEFPLIYPLANVIHAIPAGQCFEERNFSSFSFVKNSKRTQLSAENLKNILMIRLNKDLFYEYKQKQIDDIVTGKISDLI